VILLIVILRDFTGLGSGLTEILQHHLLKGHS
jgi:hypothetical protein